jgi:hypothetical protein
MYIWCTRDSIVRAGLYYHVGYLGSIWVKALSSIAITVASSGASECVISQYILRLDVRRHGLL